MNIAKIIDEHRSTGRWVGDGVRVECTCGHISAGSHPGGPQTAEDNAHRDADRKHAAHVEEMLQDALRAEKPAMERVSPLGTPGITYRAVERTIATKYQIQAFEREYPELVVGTLLSRAAHKIGQRGNIPTQIKIDRAPVGQGEKITVTWFA